MKKYRVYYTIKMNSNQYVYYLNVEAKNQKEACDMVKRAVFKETGRNAFHPGCKPEAGAIEGYPPKKM